MKISTPVDEPRQFRACDGCDRESHLDQWRIRRLMAGATRQLGLCGDCSRPLRRADERLASMTVREIVKSVKRPPRRRAAKAAIT